MPERVVVQGSGHVLPFPPACVWCGEPATADSICPATVRCPRCDARPGERCRLPNGHATTLHRERRAFARAVTSVKLAPPPPVVVIGRTLDGGDEITYRPLAKPPDAIPVIECPRSDEHPGHVYATIDLEEDGIPEAWCDGCNADGTPPYDPARQRRA